MAIQLFDVQCGIDNRTVTSADELLAELRRVEIVGALVRNLPVIEAADMLFDNAVLYRWCGGHPELVPCPVVIPNSGRDLPPEPEQAADAIRHGAGAVWIRPANDSWPIADWVSNPLFNALEERLLPVLCSERLVSIEQLAALARQFPKLPFILAETHYRAQRFILPLLRAFRNVHLSLGNNYGVHRGIEQIVAELGPEQLLFGTNFPGSESMGAITALMYSELSDSHRQMIGHGNFARLREGIRR